jgi:hypothetical protein
VETLAGKGAQQRIAALANDAKVVLERPHPEAAGRVIAEPIAITAGIALAHGGRAHAAPSFVMVSTSAVMSARSLSSAASRIFSCSAGKNCSIAQRTVARRSS